MALGQYLKYPLFSMRCEFKLLLISCLVLGIAPSWVQAESDSNPAWVSEWSGETSRHEQALRGLLAIPSRSEFDQKYAVEVKRHQETLAQIQSQERSLPKSKGKGTYTPSFATAGVDQLASPSRSPSSAPGPGLVTRAMNSIHQMFGAKPASSQPAIQLDGSQVPKEIEFPGKSR
jgi:hypothetical protein